MLNKTVILSTLLFIGILLLSLTISLPQRIPKKSDILTHQNVMHVLANLPTSPLLLPTITPKVQSSIVQTATIPSFYPVDSWRLNLLSWTTIGPQIQGELRQISNTPLGAQAVDWSPKGNMLWIEAVTEYEAHHAASTVTNLITKRGNPNGWSTGNKTPNGCQVFLTWLKDDQSLFFVQDGQLWLSDYSGNYRRQIDLDKFTGYVQSVETSPDGSTIAITVAKDNLRQSPIDLLLLNVETSEIVSQIENVGFGTLQWTKNGDTLAYWGRIESLIPGSFGALRLSLFTSSSKELVQFDLASLIGADSCLPTPIWLKDDSRVMVSTSVNASSLIVDLQGNSISIQEFILDFLNTQPANNEHIQLKSDCSKVISSPSGDFLLISSSSNQITTLDLLNRTITNQISGNLCEPETKITWDREYNQYLKWGENKALISVNPTQNGSRVIDAGGMFPAWSPNGRIAYWKQTDQGYALWLFDSRYSQPQQLTENTWQPPVNSEMSFPFDMTPQWAANGRAIAFIGIHDHNPEAYLLDYLSNESKDFSFSCDKQNLYFHCFDENLDIEFEYSLRWGRLLATLSGGMCGGYAYSYNNLPGAGLSWDYCQPMDGGLYNFRGFLDPAQKGIYASDPCSYFSNSTDCKVLPNGVVLATLIPTIDEICSEAFPGLVRNPRQIIAFDLSPKRSIQGYMFGFSFLSTKAEDYLLGQLADFTPGREACQDKEIRQQYQTSVTQLQLQLKANTTDEETRYKLEQIRHLAESIVIH